MDPSSSRKGTFIGGGGFRVDRDKALETLRERQLADPADFSLPWLRCAVLSGATAVRFNAVRGGLEFSFDGRPLDPRFLKNPYACLFDDSDEDSERHAHLATGLLALLRLAPRRIGLLTGDGAGRSLLEVVSPTEERLSPSRDPGRHTCLLVEWNTWRVFDRYDYLERPKNRCAMLPVPLLINGERAPSIGGQFPPGIGFTTGGLKGFLLPTEPAAAGGRAVFHLHGVRVCEEEMKSDTPITAYLDDPRFTLNAGQSGVVQNQRRERARREARRRVPRLAESLCAEQARRYPGYCRELLQAGTGGPWRALKRRLAGEGADSQAEAAGWDRTVAAWLRAACGSHEGDTPRLLDTPLFPGVTGQAYCARELRAQAARVGYIAVSRSPARRDRLPLKVVWAMTPELAASLERVVGGRRPLRWLDDVLTALAPAPGAKGGGGEPG